MNIKSQIYVKITDAKGSTALSAFSYQWQYGASLIEAVQVLIEGVRQSGAINEDANCRDIKRVCDALLRDENDSQARDISVLDSPLINAADRNDSKAFIDINARDGSIKYCFADGGLLMPLTVEEYLTWDYEENYGNGGCKELTEEAREERENRFGFYITEQGSIECMTEGMIEIKDIIEDNAALMTEDELKAFVADNEYAALPEDIEPRDDVLQEARVF